jgi:hypothetical protein
VQSCDARAIAQLETFAAVLHGARLRHALLGTERIVTSRAVAEGNSTLLKTPELALTELLELVVKAGTECPEMSSAARSAVKLAVEKLRAEQSRRSAVQSDPSAPVTPAASANTIMINVVDQTKVPSGSVSAEVTWNELRGLLRQTFGDLGAEYTVLTGADPPGDEVLIDGPGVFEAQKEKAKAMAIPGQAPEMNIRCVAVLRNVNHCPRRAVAPFYCARTHLAHPCIDRNYFLVILPRSRFLPRFLPRSRSAPPPPPPPTR